MDTEKPNSSKLFLQNRMKLKKTENTTHRFLDFTGIKKPVKPWY